MRMGCRRVNVKETPVLALRFRDPETWFLIVEGLVFHGGGMSGAYRKSLDLFYLIFCMVV